MIDGDDQWHKSGTAAAPITIAANPGETVQFLMGEQLKWTWNASLYGGCWSAALNGTMYQQIMNKRFAGMDMWRRLAGAGSGGGWHVTRTEGTVTAVAGSAAAGGSGYKVGDILWIASNSEYPGGNSAKVRVNSTGSGGAVATVSLADGGVDGYHVGVCATTPVTGAGAGCKVVVTQAAPSAGFTTGNLTIRGCINAGTNPVSHYDRFYYDYATNTIYFKTNNGANLDRELQFTSDLSTFTFGVSGQPSGSQVSYVVIDGLHWYYGFSPIHLATADYKNINHLTIRNCWFKACHNGPTLYGSYLDFGKQPRRHHRR